MSFGLKSKAKFEFVLSLIVICFARIKDKKLSSRLYKVTKGRKNANFSVRTQLMNSTYGHRNH